MTPEWARLCFNGASYFHAVAGNVSDFKQQIESGCLLLGGRQMIGRSAAMQRLYDAISRLASLDLPVLIVGETGSGKELVARALHYFSARGACPFIVLDCGALPSTLIESELFGCEKGAFTGAASSRRGLFEAAGNGTVFIDEISQLPLSLQSHLLRVLQERVVRPLGSVRTIRLGARFVYAMNRDPNQCLREGKLREDLYYRLNGVTVRVPALRERKEDIPALVEHFLKSCSAADGSSFRLSDAAMSDLVSYDWPGNVRELEKCIEAAVCFARSATLGVLDLPERIRKPAEPLPPAESVRELGLSLKEVEETAIRRAMEQAQGNKLLAAKFLGIGKTTLYRRLKEMRDGLALLSNPGPPVHFASPGEKRSSFGARIRRLFRLDLANAGTERSVTLLRDLVENLNRIPPAQFYLIEPALNQLLRDVQLAARANRSSSSEGRLDAALESLYQMRDAFGACDAGLAAESGNEALRLLK